MTTQNSHLSEIASIISSCRRLEELGNNKTGPRKIIREAIFFIWETGVNKPTKFSKKRARSIRASKEKDIKNLRYDHPIPLKIIIEKLYSLEEINEASLLRILNRYIKEGGILITKEEDKVLNEKSAHGSYYQILLLFFLRVFFSVLFYFVKFLRVYFFSIPLAFYLWS